MLIGNILQCLQSHKSKDGAVSEHSSDDWANSECIHCHWTHTSL